MHFPFGKRRKVCNAKLNMHAYTSTSHIRARRGAEAGVGGCGGALRVSKIMAYTPRCTRNDTWLATRCSTQKERVRVREREKRRIDF